MTEILNELSELVYIADLDTFELLFLNEEGKRSFGISDDQQYKGKKCYEVLQHRDKPCPFCTNSLLSVDRSHEWEFFNPVTNRYYLLKDKLVKWAGGRLVRMEIALDISEIKIKQKEMEKVVQHELFINECLRLLHRLDSIDRNIQDILAATGTFFKADRTYIFDINFDTQTTSNIYEWCSEGVAAEIENLQAVPLSVIDRWLAPFQRNDHIYIPSVEAIQDSSPEEYDVLARQGIHGLIAIPLLSEKGSLIGYIGVDNPSQDVSAGSIEFIFKTLSFFLVSALVRSNMEKQLKDMSFKDMLTGLQNRNKFINDLDLIQNVDNHHVGIAYVDLNGLKAINDSQGHEKGNEALQLISKNLVSLFRHNNLYRVGGDEFVILCADIPRDVFERKINELNHSADWNDSVSVSVGHLWFEDVLDIHALVREADAIMYRHKKQHYDQQKLRVQRQRQR